MSGAPEAAVQKHTMHYPKKRCPPSRRLYFNRLGNAISNISKRLNELATLGRPGQWILHHEDLYRPTLDTRPQSRNPDEEVPVRGLTYYGAAINDEGLIWAGKGPAPDFQDVKFWEDKLKGLDDKIEQVKARLVHPLFTPEELQTLESLEQQPGHFFHTQVLQKRRRIGKNKVFVFNTLLSLAKLGRPGQWILHREELYHPAIDTRPQTRATENRIVIRDSTLTGATLFENEAVVDLELVWGWNGPSLDFDDDLFWESKGADLKDKLGQVKDGLVQPQFSPDELRTLEMLEADEDHAFAKFLKEQKERPPEATKTPEEVSAFQKLARAKDNVRCAIDDLWHSGLAGKWVLHHEALYNPMYDTRFRERQNDEDGDIFQETFTMLNGGKLHFDKRLAPALAPAPAFDDPAFWEAKQHELENKKADIVAGRLTVHHFSPGELMVIELLERAILDQLIVGKSAWGDDGHKTKQVVAWLNGGTYGALPEREGSKTQTPPSSPPATHSSPDHTGDKKRKRSSDDNDNDDGPRLENSTKRSKGNTAQPLPQPQTLSTIPPPRPSQHSISRQMPPSPRQRKQGRPRSTRTAPSTLKIGRQLPARRGTQRPQRGRGALVDHQTEHLASAGPSAGRPLMGRGVSPVDPPSRRSARIAALPARKYS